MRITQSSIKFVPTASQTTCPTCGKEMRLAYKAPEQSGHDLYDLRTFECRACDKRLTKAVQM